MTALIPLLGKILDPLLKMFFGARFSLAELLISNRQARKAGREEVIDEARDLAVERLQDAHQAIDVVRRDPAKLERLRARFRRPKP